MNGSLEDRLAEIRTRFVSALQTHGSTIQKAIDSIENGDDEQSSLRDLKDELHKIAGTAAPLGFRELGERARSFEDRIERYLNRTDENQGEILVGLQDLLQTFLLTRQHAISPRGNEGARTFQRMET